MTLLKWGAVFRKSRKTAENTVKHHDGSVGSVVANHRGGGESSVVVTTLVDWTSYAKSWGISCVYLPQYVRHVSGSLNFTLRAGRFVQRKPLQLVGIESSFLPNAGCIGVLPAVLPAHISCKWKTKLVTSPWRSKLDGTSQSLLSCFSFGKLVV